MNYPHDQRLRTFEEFKTEIAEIRDRSIISFGLKIKTPSGEYYKDEMFITEKEIEYSKCNRVEDIKITMYYQYLSMVAWKE